MRAQTGLILLPLGLAAALFIAASRFGTENLLLAGLGLALGLALYHGSVSFTGSYRRFLVRGETGGIEAQILMLAAASLLFAPILAGGTAFGHPVHGAIAPVGVSMAFGAFLFGIGMQLAGGCGSGTLYTLGGGSSRMLVTLVFFAIGGLWGSLDLPRWRQLPEMPGIDFAEQAGTLPALSLQLVFLALLYGLLRRFGRHGPMVSDGTRPSLLKGPWPLAHAALLLALLNAAILAIDGSPWGITWGLTLAAAKTAAALGWDPTMSAYWQVPYRVHALEAPLLADSTALMDAAIIIGAMTASILAARFRPALRLPFRHLLASVLGGLMLGYGSRLAYGCNIGAFFSGVASMSLHGWVWIAAALPGNALGVRLRPLFGLAI